MSQRLPMPSITYIVARSYPGSVIGCDNELPWHLRTDLQRFKSLTTDHAIIMGRKTFDSIGRALPNRDNIILTRTDGNDGPNLKFVKDKESALFFADYYSILNGKKEIFVIGGSEIYNIFSGLFNKIYLTLVFANVNGDAFFIKNFDEDKKNWKCLGEDEFPKSDVDQYASRFITYEKWRKFRNKRYRLPSEFLTHDPNVGEWLKNYEKILERDQKAENVEEGETDGTSCSPSRPELPLLNAD